MDIKLGVDVATLAQSKVVVKIILIAGDSDFVPAAKLLTRPPYRDDIMGL